MSGRWLHLLFPQRAGPRGVQVRVREEHLLRLQESEVHLPVQGQARERVRLGRVLQVRLDVREPSEQHHGGGRSDHRRGERDHAAVHHSPHLPLHREHQLLLDQADVHQQVPRRTLSPLLAHRSVSSGCPPSTTGPTIPGRRTMCVFCAMFSDLATACRCSTASRFSPCWPRSTRESSASAKS